MLVELASLYQPCSREHQRVEASLKSLGWQHQGNYADSAATPLPTATTAAHPEQMSYGAAVWLNLSYNCCFK